MYIYDLHKIKLYDSNFEQNHPVLMHGIRSEDNGERGNYVCSSAPRVFFYAIKKTREYLFRPWTVEPVTGFS